MDEGEGRLLLEQIRQISREVLDNLNEIDSKLAKLQEYVETSEEIDKENLINDIKNIRTTIGAIEREDTEGLEEEKILENLIEKVDSLIKMTFG